MRCSCSRHELCDRCVEDGFAQLRGVAACRGECWAMAVARQCSRRRRWPTTTRTTDIARRKVGDLTGDPRLAERLASELVWWAARWWDAPVVP